MARLTIITRDGVAHHVDGKSDISVMQIAREHGFEELLAMCGGCCSCGTCHVYVDAAFENLLSPGREDEKVLVEASDHHVATSRLSCQVHFSEALDSLKVTIAPEG